MLLYSYFRSSAAYRVRIALNLKGLAYDQVAIHLGRGEQKAEEYRTKNPQRLVPALDIGDQLLTQSLAIIEYLEEVFPQPALLPKSAADRAHVRALALMVAADIHPIQNLRVLNFVRDEHGQEAEGVARWYNHWIATGFEAIEATLVKDSRTGDYCFGDQPGLTDIMLVPQALNAKRYKLDMRPYPTISTIVERCNAHPAFVAAHPSNQPDAEPL